MNGASTKQTSGNAREYAWTRFWAPLDATYPLDRGYLLDPESRPGRLLELPLEPLSSLRDVACLVLLGEAGSGKTREVARECSRLAEESEGSGLDAWYEDLGQFGGGDHLYREVFASDRFRRWEKGGHRLVLFLDGLDEGLSTIESLGKQLLRELGRLDAEQRQRLSFRLTCRTAEWLQRMGFLGTQLSLLWGSGQTAQLDLAPLRERDVRSAAEAHGIDPDSFVARIRESEVSALAIRPLTLDFLLDEMASAGKLPSSAADLYGRGCRRLCETSPERAMRGRGGSPDRRLAVAKRVAAVTVLSNRSAVWLGADFSSCPSQAVDVQDLLGGMAESSGKETFEVEEDDVLDILRNTGLFVGAGEGATVTWAHRTYAEFLAASYLAGHRTPASRVVDLLTHPGGCSERLVPQLYGLAGWVCSLNEEVAEQILQLQPEVLLLGDPRQLPTDARAHLVAALLGAFERRELHDRHEWVARRYEALEHPALCEQLRPYLHDGSANAVVRRAAIQIAERCGLDELADELIEVSLDETASVQVRGYAIHALEVLGDVEQRKQLVPLVVGTAVGDVDDELKGSVLRALWPGILSTDELVPLLTEAKNLSLLGTYWSFLTHHVPRHLVEDDLPQFLRWVEAQPQLLGGESHVFNLVKAVMESAWEHLEDPRVRKPLARALISRRRRHDEPSALLPEAAGDSTRLKLLVRILIEMAADADERSDEEQRDLMWLAQRTAHPVNVDWLIEQFRLEDDGPLRPIWSSIVASRLNWDDVDSIHRIVEAADADPELMGEIGPWLRVDLSSRHAEWQRENVRRQARLERQTKEREEATRRTLRDALEVLETTEPTDERLWSHGAWLLQTYPEGRTHTIQSPTDLSRRPLWGEATDAIRSKLLDAALVHLQKVDPANAEWFASERIGSNAVLGCFALFLLQEVSPSRLDELPDDRWRIWAPVLLTWSDFGEQGNIRHDLLMRAYSVASQQLLQSLAARIEFEDASGSAALFSLRYASSLLDVLDVREAMGIHLLTLAESGQFRTESVSEIVRELMRYEYEPARRTARRWVSEATKDELVAGGAIALFLHGDNSDWDVLGPFLADSEMLAKEVALAVADTHDDVGRRFQTVLDDDQLADLYEWLARKFPHNEDVRPTSGRAYQVTPRMDVAEWRDSLLTELKNRGTTASVQALRELSERLPHLDWLPWTVRDADERYREQSWVRWLPGEVVEIITDHEHPVIRNERDLLGLLERSLRRLQGALQQGPTPAAARMWNTQPNKPKSEQYLSDEIARHLRDDLGAWGIRVSREEETRPSGGRKMGERNDIVVGKFVPQTDGTDSEIRCVIEVKACYHRDLKTAMRTQLVDRYLKNGAFRAGIFLVVWFDKEGWVESDQRKKRVPFQSAMEARRFFREQRIGLQHQMELLSDVLLDVSL